MTGHSVQLPSSLLWFLMNTCDKQCQLCIYMPLWSAAPCQGGQGRLSLILFTLQDLAWAISYYMRFFYTYIPFYGILGALVFLNFIRYPNFAGSPCAFESTGFAEAVM